MRITEPAHRTPPQSAKQITELRFTQITVSLKSVIEVINSNINRIYLWRCSLGSIEWTSTQRKSDANRRISIVNLLRATVEIADDGRRARQYRCTLDLFKFNRVAVLCLSPIDCYFYWLALGHLRLASMNVYFK